MIKIFLSYSHDDKKFARKLAHDLSKAGHFTWFDNKEVMAGDYFIDKISEAINTADFFVPLISRTSIHSQWVKMELHAAMIREATKKGAFVLPARIDNTAIPVLLTGKIYIDFRNHKKYISSLAFMLKKLAIQRNIRTSNLWKEHTCLECLYYWSLTRFYYGGWGICSNNKSKYHKIQCQSDGNRKNFQNSYQEEPNKSSI